MSKTTPILSVPNNYVDMIMHRLAARTVESDSGCWIWTGQLDESGYGKFKMRGRRSTGSHRASWLVYRGDIPEGLVVDHLCRNRACVNPWHMDLVTVRVNTRRGEMAGRVGHAKDTHCKNGHPFSGANLYVYRERSGYVRRVCIECRRRRSRAWKDKSRSD